MGIWRRGDGFQEGQFLGYRARLRPRYHDEIAYNKDYDDANDDDDDKVDDDVNKDKDDDNDNEDDEDDDDDDDDEKKQDLLHGIEQLVQPGAKLTKAALKELVEQYRNNSDNSEDETDSDDDYSDYSKDEDDDDEDKDKEDQYVMTPSTRSIGLTDNSSNSEDDYS